MSVDTETQQLLRALGEAALRLADGQPIDNRWIGGLVDSPARQTADQRLLTVSEACARLRISRWSFYRLIHQRQLNTVTIGRRRFVPNAELHRFVTALGRGVTP